MKRLVFSLLFSLACAAAQPAKFHVIRQWKYVNFTWPDEGSLKSAEAQGLYIPENIVIAGVKYFDDYFYLTLPRMKRGVPATLTRIKAGGLGETSPDLEPFPSWQMNSIEDCNNLQNVQNVEIDTKGQMWIIDGGRIDTQDEPIVKCPPKLLVFDIKRNATSLVYNFPEEVAPKNGSYLFDIVVDNTDGGYAYVTDNGARDPGIIVFSVKENRAWKIRHEASMAADPQASTFQVNNVSISAPVNIAGIALGPRVHASNNQVVVNEAREVYYSPLSSLHLYSINTSVLRNENLTLQSYDYTSSVKDVGTKPSQGGAMIMDNQGILYYSLIPNNAIGRWDTHTSFQSEQRLIARDSKFIQWPSSFAFDMTGNLTVVVNGLQRFIFEKIDLSRYNFRLISAKVGGKSYLYDENYNYENAETSSSAPSSTTKIATNEVTTRKPTMGTAKRIEIERTVSGGSRFIAGLFSLALCSILFLV